ncbi:hypothetical protein SAMN05444422_11254 [Halobiforma haloterrestris]|uniref:Uncharacterized protein n=1 Tax=Natronobacterium haloterrestre TaxID=148448 RepID=A0A1I1KMG6_NATHA|nr:hypothetical protein [Halobiforma haloterrestris]SFC62154.1 hypothetical protein SAMN05444422_11254 [Halobiforma haloterrestris]
MNESAAGLKRWTQRFVVASTAAFAATLLSIPAGADGRTVVLLGLFGFVCPMIFGMGYLLLPPYAGRTLSEPRLAGVHFVLAYLGVAFLVGGWLRDGIGTLFTAGAVLWTLGVATFVGSLAATVCPVLLERPGDVFKLGDRPQRSTRVATAAIPVALGYLLIGTVALLASTPLVEQSVAFPRVSHVYAFGFGAVLVFALGARLLVGFYHVSPPRSLAWPTLAAGAIAPAFLAAGLGRPRWFRVGALLAGIAMVCYLLLVAVVAVRTDRSRTELAGIGLGALAGALAVAVALPLAFGAGIEDAVAVHRTLVLAGFFPLTIAGYAYQFFPVPDGRFPGASERTVALSIALLASGVTVQAAGIACGTAQTQVRSVGVALSFVGAVVYGGLLAGRFAT